MIVVVVIIIVIIAVALLSSFVALLDPRLFPRESVASTREARLHGHQGRAGRSFEARLHEGGPRLPPGTLSP